MLSPPFDLLIEKTGLRDLVGLQGLQAYYDALTASSVTYTAATGLTSQWSDLSGLDHHLLQGTGANQPIYLPWSGSNYGWLPQASGNYFSYGPLAAFGTGEFTLVQDVIITTVGTQQAFLAGVNNATTLTVLASGKVQSSLAGVADNPTPSTTALSAGVRYTIGYVRSGTTGTFYINGVSDGTTTDSQNYSVGCSYFGISNTTPVVPFGGKVFGFRAYSSALTGPQMLADYGGTQQANCILNASFSSGVDGPAPFTAAVGGTVTVVKNGGKPAFIVGRPGLLGDGSAFYMKATGYTENQPVWRAIVCRILSWTAGDYLCDGNAADTAAIIQTTGSPQLNISAGSSVAANTGLAVGSIGVVTAVFNGANSSLQINNGVATTGNAGAGNAGGLTLFAKSDGTSPINAIVYGAVDLNRAPTAADVARVVKYFSQRWSISV